jgi:anti-sigma factor RsiW
MISEQDFERLSAYVDDALSAAEKAALEARLQQEPELKAALRDLRLQTRALRDLPRLKPPRNFTLSPQQAQTLRPARPSLFASLFPALRLATAVSAFAFVAVLAASFITANQGSLALAPEAAPVAAVTQLAEAEQPAETAAVAGTPEAAALAAPSGKQALTPEGAEAVESLEAARTATDAATAQAATPSADFGLAQIVTETPAPALTDSQVFLPSVAAEPAQPAPPPLSPLALSAAVLGVITLVLALATWLARRR